MAFYKSYDELIGRKVETEVLDYESKSSNGNLVSIVSKDGKALVISTLVPNQNTMVVTDLRTGKVKTEQISRSTSLAEVAKDMRSLGYLTENQSLRFKR